MSHPKITRRLFLGQTFASIVTLPARAEPALAQDGFRVLEAREGMLQLLPEPGVSTAVWGYDGQVPGPLLRYKTGEEVKVRLINQLSQPTAIHWHGVRIVNAMDGTGGLTQDPVRPGGSFDYRFTLPDSGLYWYHPHALPFSHEQLGRGLYGVLIVDEPEPPVADRDMLAVLADWKLGENGQIADFDLASDGAGAGRAGPLVTLNSDHVPALETLPPSSRVRLRLLNAAHSRIMVISFSGITPLVLAIDGEPCEVFEPAGHRIPLGPGARFDVMFDLPAEAGGGASVILLGGMEPDRVLLAFKAAGERRPALPPIVSLPQNPLLPSQIKLEASHKTDILIEAVTSAGSGAPVAPAQDVPLNWKLNGQAVQGFGPVPLFSVKSGTPVTLGFINRTAFVQQMHVHGHALRILHDLDDGWEPYWRDCVLVPAGKTKRTAFIAGNPGKWAVECLMAGRQASGMAAWFQVT
jgi:FtsP/CotA-like multicopper oxidase with cupredoxin domain